MAATGGVNNTYKPPTDASAPQHVDRGFTRALKQHNGHSKSRVNELKTKPLVGAKTCQRPENGSDHACN